MNRSLARYRMQQQGNSLLCQWVGLMLCTADEPLPRWHRLLTLVLVLFIAAGVVLLARPVSADAPAWWADRVVCLPMSDVPLHERCGVSLIGPWDNRDDCQRHGQAAWRIEAERLEKAGWGGLELGPIGCSYRGADTVS